MKTNNDKIIVKIICGQNKGNISRFKISKIKEAEPILIQMLNDDEIDKYIRKLIFDSLQSLQNL